MREMTRVLGLAAICVAGLAAAALAAAPPVDDCDRLAAHPADPAKVAPGVQWDIMDARAAIAACEKAVERHPDALRFQFQLGRALLRAQRRDEGLPYLFAVAQQNYLVAFANIGGTYQFDLGNYAEALKWYRRGADLGDVSAQTHLADLYFYGHGVEKNYAEALKWLLPSARNDYAFAQYKIGQVYQTGDRTVRKDLVKAIEWFERAAEQGFARAQNDLGFIYERGRRGVRPQRQRAAAYYLRAARQGWAVAQLNLAALYEKGRGVKKNYGEAFYWYRLAVTARGTNVRDAARKDIQRLRKRLDRDEIAQVDARIANWTPDTPESTATNVPQTAVAEAAQPATGEAVELAYIPPPAADAGYQPPPATGQADQAAASADAAYLPPAQDTPAAAEPPAAEVELAPITVAEATTRRPRKAKPESAAPLAAVAAVAVAPVAPKSRFAEVDFGRYFALVIGNNEYRTLPKLETAVPDAKAVAELLENGYGYDVTLMLNATRADIVTAFDEARTRLTKDDNLLIYYAGHGIIDYATNRGYWLPIDASEASQVNWISNATISDSLKAMDAKHVMVVVDSCFSGTLTRDIKSSLQSPEYLRRMSKKRARVALASGGLEPVSDSGGSGHSVFARAFLDALTDNQSVAVGTELFLGIRRQVMLGAPQTPEYSDIRFAGHDGGDFLFVRKSGTEAGQN